METSFDFGRVLKNCEKKHKSKPAQFVTVAGGVQKRLENNLKHRKSSRLTVFDKKRDLSRCESPVAVSDAQSKIEHRRLQLEKWKEEKEKRKKEAASQKKKPFVAGVAHVPLKFVPPPPLKAMPSTSGRVTRSQSAKQNVPKSKAATKPVKAPPSFAPKNASFKPPQIKNLIELPKLAPVKKSYKNKINYTLDPVFHNNSLKPTQTRQTRSRATIVKPVDVKTTRHTIKETENKIKGRVIKKASPNNTKRLSKTLQSSSSSETDSSKTLYSSELDSASSLEKSPILIIKSPRKSIPKDTKLFKPKNSIPKSESSSEEKLRSPKSPADLPKTPEQIAEEAKKASPRVTMSRGKDNARREMKKKMDEGLLDDDASNMESVDHFRRQLNSEIKRMTEMCEVWDKIQDQTVLSESIQELVRTACGQARLLMSQKLQQFSSLVERCARPAAGAALVTPADLHGFWDMVYMQVENIDLRFKKLEELRARGWKEEKPARAPRAPRAAPPAPAAPAAPAASAASAASKKAAAPSRLREMIAAARKAKKEQEPAPASPVRAPTPQEEESKTFEAGFFSVRSPVRSPVRSTATTVVHTPNNKTLLKAVLSSEAKKSASKNSSFAILRASILSKNVEHEGIAPLPQTPLTPINLHATPGRSILKSTNIVSEKKTGKKSIKVVLFDNSDNNIEENVQLEIENLKISCVNQLENADSGMSSMDVDNEEQKENKGNSRRKSRLVRQDATADDSPVMTRSRRKSVNALEGDVSEKHEEKTPRRSMRKMKALQEMESNIIVEKDMDTLKRSERSRKSTEIGDNTMLLPNAYKELKF